MTTLVDRLLGSWPGPAGVDVAEDLVRRYAEPHRHYHDQRHLGEVLAAVEQLASHADDIRAVRLAAWFHDAVYDPRASDNERRSAALARAVIPTVLGDRVAELVETTVEHAPDPGDGDSAVLCDADLAVLATSPTRYAEYAADVRREYAHVPDDVFASVRSGVLAGFLDRERLYTTATAQARWERAARHNLEREISALGGDATRLR